LDDPSSFDPKLATLKENDFYLNGNILKGQELLKYVNNIKKETLKIVTRKGQEEEKYNFATNEIKGIASAPEYASTISTREQGSASAPEFLTDNFDASKYTPSELNQRKYAMSLPTKLDECANFKSNNEKKKCNKKYTWFEEYKKNDNEEEVLKTNEKKDRVCGIKIFMGSSTGNMLVDNHLTLDNIFRKSELLIATHCEDERIIKSNLQRIQSEKKILEIN
jgi:hypothetical protein